MGSDRSRGRRRRFGRPVGCLLWLIVLLALLILLSALFGGFQKGTRAGGLQVPRVSMVSRELAT
jgi:hypothetical protein